ncbi:MAG: formylglycine-generating enzyme family protein [Saprospiraceae bacterium]|nr:formylglycine-generating enzyme family protein [Saprospiraceae bacterium]
MIKILLAISLSIFLSINISAQHFYKIPAQEINLYDVIGYEACSHFAKFYSLDTTTKSEINAFEISEFITFKEYKVYLESVKKDSSEKFYLSQFPDSNITIDANVYKEYITNSDYDDFPVLGISWDNAMNFCRWKTLQGNSKDNIEFIYRLPQCSEWLASSYYLDSSNINNDFNEKYSDWLIGCYNPGFYYFPLDEKLKENFYYDIIYFHKSDDHQELKRKLVIGDSFLYQNDVSSIFYTYYADEGYRQIAFRIVIDKDIKSNNSLLEFWGLQK